MENNSKFMHRAIELSIQSAKTKGGPFGCVIVKDNKNKFTNKQFNHILRWYNN